MCCLVFSLLVMSRHVVPSFVRPEDFPLLQDACALKHPRQTTRCCSLYCIYLIIYIYICTYAIQILSILCMIFTTYYIIDNTCHALKHFHKFLNCLARWQSSCDEMWWTGLIFVSMQTVESLFSSIRGITCLCSIAVAACSQNSLHDVPAPSLFGCFCWTLFVL